jgi:serine protease Do
MKNVKFGMFCLGLAGLVGTAVSTLDAQTWTIQAEPGRRVEVQRPDVLMLDGRGAQLGVMVSDVDPSTRQPSQANADSLRAGVRVDEVNAGSPAEKAGIKAGDVVVEYDGERVRSARQFTRLVQETPEGRSVAIAILRDGKRQTVNATPETSRMTWNFGPDVDRALREAERGMREFRFDEPREFRFDGPREFRFDDREPRRFEYRLPERVLPFMRQPRGRLGVQVQSLTPELEEYFGVKNGGALVSSVSADSAASKAGIKAGDVIVSINGRSVADSDDLLRELEDIDGEATIVVMRDKKQMTLKAVIERARPAVPRAGSRPGVM